MYSGACVFVIATFFRVTFFLFITLFFSTVIVSFRRR